MSLIKVASTTELYTLWQEMLEKYKVSSQGYYAPVRALCISYMVAAQRCPSGIEAAKVFWLALAADTRVRLVSDESFPSGVAYTIYGRFFHGATLVRNGAGERVWVRKVA